MFVHSCSFLSSLILWLTPVPQRKTNPFLCFCQATGERAWEQDCHLIHKNCLHWSRSTIKEPMYEQGYSGFPCVLSSDCSEEGSGGGLRGNPSLCGDNATCASSSFLCQCNSGYFSPSGSNTDCRGVDGKTPTLTSTASLIPRPSLNKESGSGVLGDITGHLN